MARGRRTGAPIALAPIGETTAPALVTPREPKNQNLLLTSLSPPERAVLESQLELVSIRTGEVLIEMGDRVDHVYFPQTGVISVVRPAEDGTYIETATVGREGMAGIEILFGGTWAPARLEVQVPGLCFQISAVAFTKVLGDMESLRSRVGKYVLSYLDQISQSVVCNSRHSLAQRCARWLLMAHDRVEGDSFELTHKVLARMLDARRPGVTEALVSLKRKKLIDYRHGIITILDRPGLEAAACPCHGINRANLTAVYAAE